MTVKQYMKTLFNLWKIENDKFFYEVKNKHKNNTLAQWNMAHTKACCGHLLWLGCINAVLMFDNLISDKHAWIFSVWLLLLWTVLTAHYIHYYKLTGKSDLKFEKGKYVGRDKDETIKLSK